ncbi:MAG: KilA-N domain-containing protein [Candidatus Moranbacteria bacterium]|nr:KilA-N domain-containing protein [Candidatus Moranbacteria bacterium]
MKRKINVKNTEIVLFQKNKLDYISLTDIARYKNAESPADVVKNWTRTKSTIEFLGLWERLNNPNFKLVEFDGFKNEAGSNAFVLSPQKWIEKTGAIGIISKSGRYGGTYAHKDIAFEFASWISAEFKLYLIKEFQRLKEEESERKSLGWDLRRNLVRINYQIHTDAIKEKLIPPKISKNQENMIYANEADVLNVALFGMTTKDWRDRNSGKEGNIRDYSSVEQLVCLSNLESMNALFIKQGIIQKQRLQTLNEIAIDQMKTLLGHGNSSVKRLK